MTIQAVSTRSVDGEGSGKGKQRRRWLGSPRGWIAVGLTGACLVYLVISAQFPSLEEAMRRAAYDLLGLAFLFNVITIVCKAARWRLLYPAQNRPSLNLAVAAIAAGQVANWAVPTRLGEVVRVALVTPEDSPGGRAGHGVAVSMGVLTAEKILDAVILLLLVAIMVAIGGLPGWVNSLGLAFLAAASLGGMTLLFVLEAGAQKGWPFIGFGRLARRLLPSRISSLSQYLGSLGQGMCSWLDLRVVLPVALWSALAWGLGGAMNYVVFKSLAIDQGWGAALAILVAMYGVAVVPSLPGRVGVFQYMCVLVLTPFGVDFDQALAFSIVLYAVVFLPPIVLGLFSIVIVGPSTLRSVVGRVRPAAVKKLAPDKGDSVCT